MVSRLIYAYFLFLINYNNSYAYVSRQRKSAKAIHIGVIQPPLPYPFKTEFIIIARPT